VPDKIAICIIAALLYPHCSASVQEALERAKLLWEAYDKT